MADREGGGRREGSLPLDAELRVALGVEPDERVWLRARGARTILLERRRGGDDGAARRPRSRALRRRARLPAAGRVRAGSRRPASRDSCSSAHEDHAKSVWVHRGELVFAASNQRIDRLGHSLVRAGAITLEQLRDAERGFRRGERFGKALVERGLLTPRELWTGLQRQVEEIVRSLFSYPAGLAYFWDGEVQPDNVVRLAPADAAPRRGGRALARRAAPLRRGALGSARAHRGGRRRDATAPPGIERLLVDALAEESALPAALPPRRARRAHRARACSSSCTAPARCASAARRKIRICTQRVRRRRAGRAAARRTSRNACEAARRAGRADRRGRRRSRAARALRAGDRGGGRRAIPALLAGVVPAPAPSLDPERSRSRAHSALPEGSARDVHDALGALVDYLEFELKNHPGVTDADAVLDAVAPLRAKLRG